MIHSLAPCFGGAVPMDGSISRWFDREIAGCSLADRRLTKRLRSLLERMGDAIGRAFLGPARTGRTPRPPTASFPISGSAKRRSWPAISTRRASVLRRRRGDPGAPGHDRVYLPAGA